MKSKNTFLRKAVLADAEALVSCIDSAYAKYSNSIPAMPLVSYGIAEEITQNQVWVVAEEDEIIAGLFLVPKDGFMKLANLVVHPNHSGKGIGRKLTELAESEAGRQGFNEMRLNTHIAMPENVQLYEYLGWEKFSQTGSTISMRKLISGV